MKMLDIKLLKRISEYSYSETNGYVKIAQKGRPKKNDFPVHNTVPHKAHDFVRSLSGI